MKNHLEIISVFFFILLPTQFSSERGKILLKNSLIFYEAVER